jgi:predicted glycoside hydrolase/deacetylase ChbG (UPF0249 family)
MCLPPSPRLGVDRRHRGLHRAEVLKGAVPGAETSIRLVVNADGFGTSASRNGGILRAHRDGIVTSTSVLGNAAEPATHAAELATAPGLGTGVLLVLSGGAPVAPASQVPSLLGPDGQLLPRTRDVLLAWAKTTLRKDDVERELSAQVARWQDLGLRIDHLATKDNLAGLPLVAAAVESVAHKHGIAGLRMLGELPTLAWAADIPRGLATAAMGALSWYARRHMGALRHGPQSWGHFESGRLDEIRLLEIVGRLGAGSHELRCAPELDDPAAAVPRLSELFALTSSRVREALLARGIELCRWADLF